MKTISALLICGVDYKSARNMDYREVGLLIDEWVKIKGNYSQGGEDEKVSFVVE